MIDSVVGNYRIVEKVGEGGMGAVYRAIDLMLEREVAIKAIRPELARDPEIVERFRAEAKLAARVSHPAIATIYSFFVEGEDLFLAMEFVRGKTLSRLLQESGPLPWDQAVALLDMALDGIDRAHRAGIVHRDLKPDNLMITDLGMVKVMDFGIARAAGTGRLTRTGLLIGTLRYMAPEQIRGEEVDRRTDVYALGTVLYETLTGRVPFDGTSDYAVLKAQVEEQPAPPSRNLPGLPSRLDQAILKALAKDPAERFQTVEEMRRFLLGQGSAAAALPLAGAAPPPGTSSGMAWSRLIAEQPTLASMPTPVPGRATAPAAAGGGGVPGGAGGTVGGDDVVGAKGARGAKGAVAATGTGPGTAGAGTAALPGARMAQPLATAPPATAARPAAEVSSYRDVSLAPGAAARRRLAPMVALAFVLLLVTALAVTFLRRSPATAPAATAVAAAGVGGGALPAAAAQPAGAAVPAGGAMPAPVVVPPPSAPDSAGTAAGGNGNGNDGSAADGSRGRRRSKAARDAVAGDGGAAAQGADGAAGGAAPAGAGSTAAGAPATAAGGGAAATAGGDPPVTDVAEELRRLGAEIVLASDDLRAVYAESLERRNQAAGHQVVTAADEQLKDQLRALHAAAEHFRAPFGGGFFARTRARLGRMSHGEDENQQIKRLAHELSQTAAWVDTAMAAALPAPAVAKAWRHLHRLCERVAALAGQ